MNMSWIDKDESFYCMYCDYDSHYQENCSWNIQHYMVDPITLCMMRMIVAAIPEVKGNICKGVSTIFSQDEMWGRKQWEGMWS
ncbi:hypothetical protein Syun_030429 [Stephania yunnanensis]|uniref:Uncharacterized protein n=1 Tax=Stephania yunnanensis TaxID=152371 RepID=A0AAP0HMA0_9MAGN